MSSLVEKPILQLTWELMHIRLRQHLNEVKERVLSGGSRFSTLFLCLPEPRHLLPQKQVFPHFLNLFSSSVFEQSIPKSPMCNLQQQNVSTRRTIHIIENKIQMTRAVQGRLGWRTRCSDRQTHQPGAFLRGATPASPPARTRPGARTRLRSRPRTSHMSES